LQQTPVWVFRLIVIGKHIGGGFSLLGVDYVLAIYFMREGYLGALRFYYESFGILLHRGLLLLLTLREFNFAIAVFVIVDLSRSQPLPVVQS